MVKLILAKCNSSQTKGKKRLLLRKVGSLTRFRCRSGIKSQMTTWPVCRSYTWSMHLSCKFTNSFLCFCYCFVLFPSIVVDWSVKGDYIAVARENTLRILSSDLKERLHMLLLFRLWANDTDHITKGILPAICFALPSSVFVCVICMLIRKVLEDCSLVFRHWTKSTTLSFFFWMIIIFLLHWDWVILFGIEDFNGLVINYSEYLYLSPCFLAWFALD